MNDTEFKEYLSEFETKVMIAGVRSGMFKGTFNVSVRPGKLDSTDFGKLIGTVIPSVDTPLALDYYGLIKKSKGFFEVFPKDDESLVVVRTPIVHFPAIKIDMIIELCRELVFDFTHFKHQLIRYRGFEIDRKCLDRGGGTTYYAKNKT
jgi:hypothetical protein